MMDKLSSHKGMSQILTLIVAASVLMMTALIIVFMAQGSLTDLFDSTSSQGCKAQVETKCSLNPGGSISKPTQCQGVAGTTINSYNAVDSGGGSSTITCASASAQSDSSGLEGTGEDDS